MYGLAPPLQLLSATTTRDPLPAWQNVTSLYVAAAGLAKKLASQPINPAERISSNDCLRVVVRACGGDQRQQASGDLDQVRGRLASARVEYSQTVQGWAEARARVGVAQQELAAITKRVQQARDVAQTGSIRAAESPKRPASR